MRRTNNNNDYNNSFPQNDRFNRDFDSQTSTFQEPLPRKKQRVDTPSLAFERESIGAPILIPDSYPNRLTNNNNNMISNAQTGRYTASQSERIKNEISDSSVPQNSRCNQAINYEFNDPINPDQELLPVHQEMLSILATIQKHKVIVISGNTGCGKSTQIPKFIACSDTSSKIIVTQPRRVAAIALAQRVSEELRSPLGQRVGYQIGQDSMVQKTTQIVYVTIGIFLQKLVNEPEEFMSEYSHIILDEVHERGIESDFGLIALKTFLSAMQGREALSIKLIVMSATLNKDIFLNYFSNAELDKLHQEIRAGQDQQEHFFDSSKFKKQLESTASGANAKWQQQTEKNQAWIDLDNHEDAYEKMKQLTCRFNCKYVSPLQNYVEIKVIQHYKVQTIWLDQIDDGAQMCNKNFFNARKPELNEDLYRIAAREIKRILCKEVQMLNQLNSNNNQQQQNNGRSGKCGGDILVFLPGYGEIMKLRVAFEQLMDSLLQNDPQLTRRHPYRILELHSSLGDINTRELLGKQDFTKIIFATNIAESSITIPNCFVVIDFALTKEINYNPSNGIERLELSWASKASITQRAGRTGRNCDGVNVRLIPRQFFEAEIRDYQTPEILRCPIDKVILKIKILDEGESEYHHVNPGDIFEQSDLIEEVISQKEGNSDSKGEESSKSSKKQLVSRTASQAILTLGLRQKERESAQFSDSSSSANRNEIKVEKREDEDSNSESNQGQLLGLQQNSNRHHRRYMLRLFEDPVRVLQRAIEAPDDFSICQSMENLISIGALKLKKVTYAAGGGGTEAGATSVSKIKVRVTRLGRFYNEIPCDIKLGKFICFGYFFDCLVDCISIASIFSQRKSFFIPFCRIANDIHAIDRFTDMIFRADAAQESDIILQLRIFQQWENKFVKPYFSQNTNRTTQQQQQYQLDKKEEDQGLVQSTVKSRQLNEAATRASRVEQMRNAFPSIQKELHDPSLSLADKINLMKKTIAQAKEQHQNANNQPAQEAQVQAVDRIDEEYESLKDEEHIPMNQMQLECQGDEDIQKLLEVFEASRVSSDFIIQRRKLIEFKKKRITREEYEWCNDHFCDPKVLREILSTREDFKQRIPKEAGDASDVFSDRSGGTSNGNSQRSQSNVMVDESHMTKIKFCLAGSFNKYTLKSDIFDVKEMMKLRHQFLVEQLNPKTTLVIDRTIYSFQNLSTQSKEEIIVKLTDSLDDFISRRVVQNIPTNSVRSAQNRSQFIAQIILNYSSIYIEFAKEEKQVNVLIKEILTLKRRYVNVMKLKDKQSNTKTKEIAGTELLSHKQLDFNAVFIKGINEFKYAYEAKLNLSNQSLNKIVSLESDSINFVTLGDYNRFKYLVAADLMSRGHRVIAQGITVMPHDSPLFLAYAALIFGSQCYVNCDKDGKKYESVNVDNVEIELDHYLLDSDIREVNAIRKDLRACLDEDSFFNARANTHLDLWRKVQNNLLARVSVRVVDSEKWEDVFSHEFLSGKFEVNVEQNKKRRVTQILNSLRVSTATTDHNNDIKNVNGMQKKPIRQLFSNQKRASKKEKTTHASEKGFMNEILQTKQSEQAAVTLSDPENIALLHEYFEAYNLWKQKKIRELKQFLLLHTVDEPMITCKHCLEEQWFQVTLFKAAKFKPLLERVHQIHFNGFNDNLFFKELSISNSKIISQSCDSMEDEIAKNRITAQNQEFITNLDSLLNPLKFLEDVDTPHSSSSRFNVDVLKYYGFTNEDNQLYNLMNIPDCGSLLLLYQDLEYEEFSERCFAEFSGRLEEEELMERSEKKAVMLVNLQKFGCVVCDSVMSTSDQLNEELKQQDLGVDTKNWGDKLEKHLKSELHRNHEEAFLKSTRSINYFFNKAA